MARQHHRRASVYGDTLLIEITGADGQTVDTTQVLASRLDVGLP